MLIHWVVSLVSRFIVLVQRLAEMHIDTICAGVVKTAFKMVRVALFKEFILLSGVIW